MRVLFYFSLLFLFDSLLRFLLLCLRMIAPAWRRKSGTQTILGKKTRGCAVLIAAHDEAGTIGPTVAALQPHMPEWPGSSLYVVADRCTDATATEAAEAGALVAERTTGKLGKGAVIAWWLQEHSAAWQSKDAVLILDADTKIAPGTLKALRQAMADGADAAQAFVAPDASTNSGRLAGWSEVLMQRIDDEARRRCGWPVPLRGTGMALRGELLAELAPRLHTYAEDLELDVILASRGARVEFVPEAMIFDPKPQASAGASRQRARWLQGQLQVLRDYRREFVRALATGGAGAWFLLWLLMLRPKILFIGLRILLLAAGLFYTPLLWPALAGLAMDGVYYLAGAAMVDDPRRYLLDLLAVPRYATMWFYSFGTALIRRRVWLRAGR
ncbi:MAG TPA: glycosyltransferase [Blastocatellia bacterium]|nr:glycosyltransferase [Blastocatellia bacterium]HMZ20963.1 glycosyltransferase [Blastocatellia bacterium]HNG28949.1 glycosyltransferase [Blastocatellia bacterium]